MSRVIKSFRIVEKDDKTIFEKPNNIDDKIQMEEIKQKYNNIVKRANDEADKILEEANEKRENYLNEAYEKSKSLFKEFRESGFNEGYNEGYEKGYSEGYTKGYNEGKIASDKLIEESITIKNEYLNTKQNIYHEIEEDVIQLVINICEKIIYEKVDEDKEYIVTLILKGIDSLTATENLVIRVPKEDYDIAEMSKNKILAKASLVKDIEIKVDNNLSKGDCIIETSSGSVDMSIKDQVDKVKVLLNTILSSE